MRAYVFVFERDRAIERERERNECTDDTERRSEEDERERRSEREERDVARHVEREGSELNRSGWVDLLQFYFPSHHELPVR